MSDAAPNTKHVTIKQPVPRDPEAYRATVHFGQRLKDRVPATDRDRVVRETIERGRCYGTTPPDAVDDHDVKQTFAFERVIDGTAYRVIVGIRAAAFRDPDRKHLALTIMPDEGDHE